MEILKKELRDKDSSNKDLSDKLNGKKVDEEKINKEKELLVLKNVSSIVNINNFKYQINLFNCIIYIF